MREFRRQLCPASGGSFGNKQLEVRADSTRNWLLRIIKQRVNAWIRLHI